jgi:cytidine diphosphoramidate kinase
MQKEGRLIWITGLAGSGKTTIAKRLQERLYGKPIHLDGDNLREILSETTTHDLDGRKRTAKIYAKLCSYLTKQGADVIMSTISLINEIHDYNRKNNSNYYEVLLRVSKEVLSERDKKKLYSEKKDGVMGVNQEPEYPRNPDLILDNNYPEELDPNVEKILEILNNGRQ